MAHLQAKRLVEAYKRGGLDQVEEEDDYHLYNGEDDVDDTDDYDPDDHDPDVMYWRIQTNCRTQQKRTLSEHKSRLESQQKTAESHRQIIIREREQQERAVKETLRETMPEEMVQHVAGFIQQIPLAASIASVQALGQIQSATTAAQRTQIEVNRIERLLDSY
ncbi:hypothetical protein QKU48_gp0747 [Fadolivirus algeromassiliense]|jgi:hypothetical protein|uniref:Uncharacterized protein n=1 Tax=Fadolivirus FV1/VV64 TaxID=3070911 RepID=A0A7D3QUK8_9VIRU|nr:hypothetical protein QKU48_gp0747 [Fadolivirus algeromassiliense]QKF94205.1 hypothetical protein Fadolivirus_1_747 [Fadolivirus FV1/VV64]